MAGATQVTPDVFEQIDDLQRQAHEHESDFREQIRIVRDKLDGQELGAASEALAAAGEIEKKRNAALLGLADAARAAAGGNGVATHAEPVVARPVDVRPKPGRGKPAAQHKAKPTPPAPSKSGKAAAKKGASVNKNGPRLSETVWGVLTRKPQSFRKLLPKLPKDAQGLTMPEIRVVIEHEKKFVSKSREWFSAMLGKMLTELRDRGLLSRRMRGKDGEYAVVKNADLYGPPLKSNGKPMKEQEDGTFLDENGQVLLGADKKPLRRIRQRS